MSVAEVPPTINSWPEVPQCDRAGPVPGLRMSVTKDDQRMQAPKSVRQSAYDEAMFAMTGAARGNRP